MEPTDRCAVVVTLNAQRRGFEIRSVSLTAEIPIYNCVEEVLHVHPIRLTYGAVSLALEQTRGGGGNFVLICPALEVFRAPPMLLSF